MKVVKRIIIKLLILLFVVAVGIGGAAVYQGQRQSTPDYTIDRYLTLLTENNSEKAFSMLDETDGISLTKAEFSEAVTGKKYSLYASFKATAQEKRRDSAGNEYADYHVEFLNAADEIQMEEDFTLKKQPEQRFGMFDVWEVLPDHCMIRNFHIKVPAGSAVYLDAVEADVTWMTREKNSPVTTCTFPQLIPGEKSLTIRHPILESVNTTVDPSGETVDYTFKMPLKESAQDECKELGVAVLKNLLTASVKEKKSEIDESLSGCIKEAEKFVKEEGALLHQDGSDFKSIAVSAFAVQFSDPVFSEENGSIQTEMTFSYHYRIKRDVVSVSEDQVQEDGTPLEYIETVENSGNSTAKMTMEYLDGSWKVVSLEIPVTEK
ncbi:MAG: hypothetical protein PUF13_05145 [Lachnospiraceae bacterium]|nr:hypothetical protein [Lachnospiraceae bacterium]